MALSNDDIATLFTHYALLLEISGANPFRIQAYRNAARTLSALPQNITTLLAAGIDLSTLKNIGKDLAKKIQEIVTTGDFSDFQTLRKTWPFSLISLYSIPGIGPRHIRQFYEVLGISTLSSLIEAAEAGKLATLPRCSKKMEAKILEACKWYQKNQQRFKLETAEHIAEPLLQYLGQLREIQKLIIAGSYRRRQETVGDLDILITCTNHREMIDYFTRYREVKTILSQGDTRSTVRLNCGLQVDLCVVPETSYGAALHYFTGSKSHNIAIRKMAMARNLKINEYGVFKEDQQIAGLTEEEIYHLFGMPVITPELRENRGEIEAALRGALPKLVTLEAICGDLHTHTDATDGRHTLEEMAIEAMARGYEYIAITDHTQHLSIAHGQNPEQLSYQIDVIDAFNETLKDFRILKSAEVDILEDGSLDLPDTLLKQLDLTVGAVRSHFHLSAEKQTERILRAMENPYVTILAHPTGRLLNERDPYPLDMEKIMLASLQYGCFLELNASPSRLDLHDLHCKMAKEIGVKIAISTDAHHSSHLDFMRFGIDQARRGWLEPADILNTRTLTELLPLLKRH